MTAPRLSVQLEDADYENMQTCLRLGEEESMAAVIREALRRYAESLEYDA